ncbi:hypothetical protein [Fundidesulfovibrio putealis]|uniref:hypothetical protein n=1 Tax=Fundidesulfovibrio putealis TaxID=270496 RepID=UPI000487E2EA|nr:hypothetical protein [Fundidesulfovibrio putealis]
MSMCNQCDLKKTKDCGRTQLPSGEYAVCFPMKQILSGETSGQDIRNSKGETVYCKNRSDKEISFSSFGDETYMKDMVEQMDEEEFKDRWEELRAEAPKYLAIYVARNVLGRTYEQIQEEFGFNTINSVGQAIRDSEAAFNNIADLLNTWHRMKPLYDFVSDKRLPAGLAEWLLVQLSGRPANQIAKLINPDNPETVHRRIKTQQGYFLNGGVTINTQDGKVTLTYGNGKTKAVTVPDVLANPEYQTQISMN